MRAHYWDARPHHFDLLGGLQQPGRHVRSMGLREITGKMEVACEEIRQSDATLPAQVSSYLSLFLETSDGVALSESEADSLCVGDRRYAMLQISRQVVGDDFWINRSCSACETRFDIHLQRSQLPVQAAGRGFPHARVEIDGTMLTFRAPTGADQRAYAEGLGSGVKPDLLEMCFVHGDASERPDRLGDRLSAEQRTQIEEALDAIAPDVGTRLLTECPDCQQPQQVEFSPYEEAWLPPASLLEEIHSLAFHYHWSESTALSLPRQRRLAYLRLIDRERGLVS